MKYFKASNYDYKLNLEWLGIFDGDFQPVVVDEEGGVVFEVDGL